MKAIWSKESLDRLIEIEEFIAEDNSDKAVEFTDFLVSKSFLIERNPGIGRMVPEFSDPDIREILIQGYRFIYRIGKDSIYILTLFELIHQSVNDHPL